MVCKRNQLLPLFPVFDELKDGATTLAALSECGGRLIVLREAGDALALFSNCAAVVTMRLHALILATACAVPAVGVSADDRDEKIPAFANAAAQDFLPADGWSVAGVVETVERCIVSRRSRMPLLMAATAEMRKRLRGDLIAIASILYKNTAFYDGKGILEDKLKKSGKGQY